MFFEQKSDSKRNVSETLFTTLITVLMPLRYCASCLRLVCILQWHQNLNNNAEALTVPVAPGLPTTSDAKPEQITVSWMKPLKDGGSPITGYTVEYRAEGGSWQAANDGLSVATLNMVVRGLKPSTAYQFRVYAHNKVRLQALF